MPACGNSSRFPGEDRLLIWNSSTGNFRIWQFEPGRGRRAPLAGKTLQHCYWLKKRKMITRSKHSEAGLPVFREAVTAIDGPAFGRLERYFALFSAV